MLRRRNKFVVEEEEDLIRFGVKYHTGSYGCRFTSYNSSKIWPWISVSGSLRTRVKVAYLW